MKHRLNMFLPHLLMRPGVWWPSLCVFFITLIASLHSFSSCPLHHRQSLLQFKTMVSAYYAAESSSFTGLTSWNSSSIDCCTWERVSCSQWSTLKPVTELILSYTIARDGTYISSEVLLPLFHIDSLLVLDVSWNSLQGRIPGDELSNLTSLTYLRMSYNFRLNGSIPSKIFSMKNLYHLDLGYNLLTGNLGGNIGSLPKLMNLYLNDNNLSGEIPLWLFNLSNLTFLNLSQNNLLWNNTAEIYPKFNLWFLGLDSCNFSAKIPRWLLQQKNLKYLVLSNNNLSGDIPPWLCELELYGIDLSSNNLTGSLPSCLFESKSLYDIFLRNNNFTGELPISISSNGRLQLLDLSNNKLSGEVFTKFGNKSNLIYVNLSFNYFSDKLPLSFGTSIQNLILNNNYFSGKLFRDFSLMPNMTKLDLHDNMFTGEIPYSLGSLTYIRILNLKNNHIHGPIPDSLANLTLMRIIDLSNNKINGIIPPYFANISGLYSNVPEKDIFYEKDVETLNWKGFVQVIRSDKSMLYPTLDLSNNELTGEIPKYLGQLKNLKSLNLSHNNMNGVIPASIGQLENLESLDLSHNRLSGEIPTSFVKLNELGKLDLRNNMLTGKIPEEGHMLSMVGPSIYANNNGLCGIQINVQCVSGSASPRVLPRHVDDEEGKGGIQFIWEATCLGYVFGLAWAIWLTYFCGILGPNLIHDFFYHRRNQRNL